MDDSGKFLNLKPLRKRLEERSKTSHLRLDILQQDYLLSWLLSGICHHPLLKNCLVFKGGTALKKCYFGEYRFSEDIDFTAQSAAPTGAKLLAAITEACDYAHQGMNAFSSIQLEVKRYEEKDPHPHRQEAFSVYAQFPWQSQPLTKVMIEITREEILLINPKLKTLIHGYGEMIDSEILVYSLEEIVLEKFRAILQHTKKLHERDFSRSRARDYYDLWRIFQMFGDRLDLNLVQSLLPTKCAAKQVAFAQIEDFFDQKMILNVRRTWSQWLGPLVPNLPECELVLSDLRDTMKSII